ncbi:MAG TPA: nicotinamide riboside transporter PnuC [Flavipsychrobacter sp.]|nr:nicotinamide riboside transporter PnuC [Flavipsychrobacter sp.]
MQPQDLFTQFITQLYQTPPLEYIAVAFGVASVLLASRNHVLLYPTGIISTAIFVYIMAKAGLYAESVLNLYYFAMSIYGWWLWKKNHASENPEAISVNTNTDWLITIAITSIGWLLLYYILKTYTNSDVAALDAFVSAAAWAGMWLLARHKVENWILLNLSNLIAIPLQIHKGIPFTALLTIFLFIVAIFGYFRWRHQYRTQHAV